MPRSHFLSIAVLVATVAGCQPATPTPDASAPPDVAALTTAIQDREKQWSAAFLAADAAAISDLYTEDGASVSPSGEWDRGRTAIAAGLKRQLDSATFTAREDITEEVIPAGPNFLLEIGHYSSKGTPKAGGTERSVTGRYMVLWRKDADGVWRLHRDLGTEAPPKM